MMGNDPSEDEFSANRFQAESVDRQAGLNTDDHGRYYDRNTESLHNVAAIVTGEYDEVRSADHRRDGLRDVGVHDPEIDRRPGKVTHHPKAAQ